MSPAPIQVDRAAKWFGDLVALSDVTVEVPRGVTALLGPNGAGKSTLLRLVAGLARPSGGTVRVLGRDPFTDIEVTASIGICPQEEGLFTGRTPREFLRMVAEMHLRPTPDADAAAALRTVDLDPDDPRPVGAYSGGMRQRVRVARALVADAEVVLLDEPLRGLDPRQRANVIDLIGRLGAEDRCVLVSSHVLEEVERIGSRIVVIAQGRLAAEGDYRAIRSLMDDRPSRVRIAAEPARRLAAALVDAGVAVGVQLDDDGRSMVVDTDDISGLGRSVAPLAARHGARLKAMEGTDDDLEHVFRYLVEGRRAGRRTTRATGAPATPDTPDGLGGGDPDDLSDGPTP